METKQATEVQEITILEQDINTVSPFWAFIKKNWPLIVAIIYLLSPVDLLPEALLPGVGMADDFIVILLELVREYYLFKKQGSQS